MSAIFNKPKRAKRPVVAAPVESVRAVTDDAERERQRVKRTATARAGTLKAGIANALKRRLGE